MTERLGEKVLVVYDSPAIRSTVSLLGRDHCSRLVEIDEPADAPAAVARERPVLVLLCAMTAKTGAYDACERIKHTEPTLPTIILNLHDTAETRERARACGADEALRLSVSADDLVRHIRTHIQSSRRKRETDIRRRADDDPAERRRSTEIVRRLSDAERLLDRLENRVERSSPDPEEDLRPRLAGIETRLAAVEATLKELLKNLTNA